MHESLQNMTPISTEMLFHILKSSWTQYQTVKDPMILACISIMYELYLIRTMVKTDGIKDLPEVN